MPRLWQFISGEIVPGRNILINQSWLYSVKSDRRYNEMYVYNVYKTCYLESGETKFVFWSACLMESVTAAYILKKCFAPSIRGNSLTFSRTLF